MKRNLTEISYCNDNQYDSLFKRTLRVARIADYSRWEFLILINMKDFNEIESLNSYLGDILVMKLILLISS